MKNFLLTFFFFFGTLAYCSESIPENARKMFDAFSGAQSANISKIATAQVAAALDGDKLVTLRKSLTNNFGEFVQWDEPVTIKKIKSGDTEYLQIIRIAIFSRASFAILCVIETESERVSGFFVTPRPTPPKTEENKKVEQLTFGTNWPLEGTLTLPEKTDIFPIIVLVHGSGPNDRDETIGPNRPFAELANHLAQRGIAVFRYDKRTKVFGKKLKIQEVTLDDEVIEDATLAIEMLQKRYPDAPIFVLGHSFGGMMLPRIDKRTIFVDGYIFMATPARNFFTILDEQLEYLIGLEVEDPEIRREHFQIHRDALTGQMGEKYFADLNSYDQVAAVKEMITPMLFLQGGRDYQSTSADFNIWQKNLKDKAGVEFCFYDNLNHLMHPGQGKAVPAEYFQPGNIDPKVFNDIASFVKKNSK